MPRRVVWLACLLLPAFAARADDTAACRDVPSCMALAERTPAQFSTVLREQFKSLPASVLVDGLHWSHKRPEVTERGRTQLLAALEKARGHTRESATRLLDLAIHEKVPKGPSFWMDVLSRDQAGIEVLEARVDRGLDEWVNQLAAMQYVAAFASGGWRRSAGAATYREATPEQAARVQRCVDHFWTAWIQQRSTSNERTALPFDALVFNTSVYEERLDALVRAELAGGKVPREVEFAIFVRRHLSERSFLNDLLAWHASTNTDLIWMADNALLNHIDKSHLQPVDRSRVLRALLDMAPLRQQDEIDAIAEDLRELVSVASPADAKAIVAIARKASPGRIAVLLLAELSERFPEFQPELVARVLDPDLDQATAAIALLYEAKAPGLRKTIARWVLALKPEQLRDEGLQEQLIVVTEALDPSDHELANHVGLPAPRRARLHRRSLPCGTAVYESWARTKNTADDLTAFGLPAPSVSSAPRFPNADEVNERIPAAPPMTHQEREVRFHQFRYALRGLQARFPATASH